jgi:hypothetical protein
MASWVRPKANQTGFQAGLDFDTFKKLVARFDSSFAGEAETAFRKAVLLCAQAQTRFCDAATEAYGQSAGTAQLQAEIAELQQRLEQREKQGAALADARDVLEREFTAYRYNAEQAECTSQAEAAKLRRELAKLHMASGQIGVYCRGCEVKRRALALIATSLLGWVWFGHPEWFVRLGLHDTGAWQKVHGLFLAAAPLLVILVHWRWMKFKRKNSWVSWRDNDVYRLLADRWNQFLQRLVMK